MKMSSHMQNLLARVTHGDDREVEDAFRWMLAVVEAAQAVEDDSRYFDLADDVVDKEKIAALRDALAKLNEVQS